VGERDGHVDALPVFQVAGGFGADLAEVPHRDAPAGEVDIRLAVSRLPIDGADEADPDAVVLDDRVFLGAVQRLLGGVVDDVGREHGNSEASVTLSTSSYPWSNSWLPITSAAGSTSSSTLTGARHWLTGDSACGPIWAGAGDGGGVLVDRASALDQRDESGEVAVLRGGGLDVVVGQNRHRRRVRAGRPVRGVARTRVVRGSVVDPEGVVGGGRGRSLGRGRGGPCQRRSGRRRHSGGDEADGQQGREDASHAHGWVGVQYRHKLD